MPHSPFLDLCRPPPLFWDFSPPSLSNYFPWLFQTLAPLHGTNGQVKGKVASYTRATQTHQQSASHKFDSFEHSEVNVLIDKAKVCIIYRPPSSNLTSYLEDLFCELLIVRDFNIHVDAVCRQSAQFFNLLDQHGLAQHVKESTHNDGHILDFVITRDRNQLTYNELFRRKALYKYLLLL